MNEQNNENSLFKMWEIISEVQKNQGIIATKLDNLAKTIEKLSLGVEAINDKISAHDKRIFEIEKTKENRSKFYNFLSKNWKLIGVLLGGSTALIDLIWHLLHH